MLEIPRLGSRRKRRRRARAWLTPAQAKRAKSLSDHPWWHRNVCALKKGVVNIVDVDIPLGMVIPAAKIGMISTHDTQGRGSSVRNRRHVDITEVTFPFKPGDYVVHAVHGVALFKEIVRQEVSGVVRDYLLLQYAEGDALYVPIEQLDRVTRYVGPEGASPRLTRLNTSDWSRQLTKRKKPQRNSHSTSSTYTRAARARRASAIRPTRRGNARWKSRSPIRKPQISFPPSPK